MRPLRQHFILLSFIKRHNKLKAEAREEYLCKYNRRPGLKKGHYPCSKAAKKIKEMTKKKVRVQKTIKKVQKRVQKKVQVRKPVKKTTTDA